MVGANPMWVSRQMGHTSMKMLLEVYAKWIDLADKGREKSKLDSILTATTVPQIDVKVAGTRMNIGGGERIRTSGLYVPNVALYQAKLHPDLRIKRYG
jgi:hypothetical protein